MANFESLNRRINRLDAAANTGELRIIFRDPKREDLDYEALADDDNVLIITWKVGESDSKPPPQGNPEPTH